MPAELPRSSWWEEPIPRREGVVRIAKAFGAIYISSQFAQLLAACKNGEEFDIPQRSFNPERIRWIPEPEGRESIYLYGRTNLLSGSMVFVVADEKRVKIAINSGRQTETFDFDTCQVLNYDEIKNLLPIGIDCGWLPQIKTVLVSSLPEEFEGDGYSFKIKRDGDLIETNNSSYVLYKGRRYLTFPASFGSSKTPVSMDGFIRAQMPESANKLELREGDLLVSGGKGWYIRNRTRYGISDLQAFIKTRRFNRKIWETPSWVVDKINLGREPEKRGRTPDWDGHEIDTNAGLAIIFIGGWDGTTEKQLKAFENVKKGLKFAGWDDSRFLEFTYNFSGSHAATYESGYTKRFPGDNVDVARDFIDWCKTRLPRTRFILLGHSQGGYLAFNAALSHTDAISSVICINSPLAGVGRSLEAGEIVADLGALAGEEAALFYKNIGLSPRTKKNVEDQAQGLKRNGVEVFTLAAAKDPLVDPRFSLLESSDNSINDSAIKLLWEYVPTIRGYESPHGAVLGYDKFILELVRVIGRP